MGLKEECTDTAYVLGRLFSLLEAIQKEANPSITTTIRDRYFNSACATLLLVVIALFVQVMIRSATLEASLHLACVDTIDSC